MRELIIYKTHFVSRFLEIQTSNDLDEEKPYPIAITLDLYKRGIEMEFIWLGYALNIFIGYQDIVVIDEKDGITERNR